MRIFHIFKEKTIEKKVDLVISCPVDPTSKLVYYCVKPETESKNSRFSKVEQLTEYISKKYPKIGKVRYEHIPPPTEIYLQSFITQHKVNN